MFEIKIFFFQDNIYLFSENLGIKQINEADSSTSCLIFVAGPDATAGGSYFFITFHLFTGKIDCLVIGHDNMGFFADLKLVRTYIYSFIAQIIELF